MTMRKITASSIVIAAALASAQGWAQEVPAPADPATAAPTAPAPAPAPPTASTPAPAQPDTTPVPASDPAANPPAPTTAPAPSDPVTQPAPTEQTQTSPAPASPTAPQAPANEAQSGPTQPAPGPQADAAPAQPAAGSTQVAAFVDQEFPQADTDGNGSLSATEFEAWIGKLKSAELQSAGKPVDATEVKTYASNAFASADQDTDKLVSKVELTQFLSQA